MQLGRRKVSSDRRGGAGRGQGRPRMPAGWQRRNIALPPALWIIVDDRRITKQSDSESLARLVELGNAAAALAPLADALDERPLLELLALLSKAYEQHPIETLMTLGPYLLKTDKQQ